jgi:hypothetical protein
MPAYRRSNASARNPDVVELPSLSIEAEARRLGGAGAPPWMLLLVGGSDLLHFRLRVAQSHMRQDLAPSFWSHVGLLCEEAGQVMLYEVPLDPTQGFVDMPYSNGIQQNAVSRYDDRTRFPNVALLRFPFSLAESGAGDWPVRDLIRQSVAEERGILDLPGLILPWLAFVWGAGTPTNPLIAGTGLPAAVFAETMFSVVGVELTPGLSTRSSCPEAIWQAALWWHEYYASGSSPAGARGTGSAAGDNRLAGSFVVTQPAAAYVEQPRAASTLVPGS